MTTGTSLIAQVRDALDESTSGRWTDLQIRRWVNLGLNEIARVTRHIRDRTTLTMVAGQAEYTVPANVLEIELAYYLPGDGQYVPLAPRQFEGMDTVWGSYQNQTGGYPAIYTVWGFSPNLKARFYPVPGVNGHTVSLMVVRTPTPMAEVNSPTDATVLDFPDAWVDLLVEYAEYRALRKDKDPRWQEAKSEFTSHVDQLVVIGDYLNAPRDIIMDPYTGGVPRWLADPGY